LTEGTPSRVRLRAGKAIEGDAKSEFDLGVEAFGSDFIPTARQINRSGKVHID
jgi:hypothetical protein